ncbi:hypothetical protein I0C86_28005 [Plantactinospora sp. S1510]|uniref:Uncharacterized protein n=1 Tax=Plantactinospora alkalitolerans TaxID=2789879 RepID=A0ABS0H2R3_9ACTN|nr:hypothetical protein [Plantactinospora alkalitolerans]MBF9132770.1 hypothetical protein [Plantactinospora alkalitolerans]
MALVSDTLLLSEGWRGKYHEIGRYRSELDSVDPEALAHFGSAFHRHDEDFYGIRTPDLAALGGWILEAQPLLRAGLVWYLPSYCTSREEVVGRKRPNAGTRAEQRELVDYLVTGRKAVEASGVRPVQSEWVRTVLEIDLPFVDGVSLSEFRSIRDGRWYYVWALSRAARRRAHR